MPEDGAGEHGHDDAIGDGAEGDHGDEDDGDCYGLMHVYFFFCGGEGRLAIGVEEGGLGVGWEMDLMGVGWSLVRVSQRAGGINGGFHAELQRRG